MIFCFMCKILILKNSLWLKLNQIYPTFELNISEATLYIKIVYV